MSIENRKNMHGKSEIEVALGKPISNIGGTIDGKPAEAELNDQSNQLTFAALRSANLKRLPQFKNRRGELVHSKPDGSDWSPAQWLQAVVGELGEYANIRKKFERGDIDEEEFKRLGGKELADAATYLDILTYQFRLDLGQLITDKFNEISERIGCDVKL